MQQAISSKTQKVNSVLVSLFLSLTCVASMVNIFAHIPYMSAFIALILSVIVFIFNKKILLSMRSLMAHILLILLLTVSLVCNGTSCIIYICQYIVFGSVALVLANVSLNSKVVINFSLYIYAVYVLSFFCLGQYTYDVSSNAQMGLAYSLLPAILFSFSLLIFPRLICGRRYIGFVLSLVTLLSSLYIILFMTVTRGAILASFLGCIFLIFMRLQSRKKRIFAFSLTILLIIVLFGFKDVVIDLIVEHSRNSEISALKKLVLMADAGDVGNGRDELYMQALLLIRQKPILGYGVGYFESISGGYVHQIFLQLMCEVGILGMFIFLIPLFINIRQSILLGKYPTCIMCVTVMSVVLIMLQFSNVYWYSYIFWFLYFFTKRHMNDIVSKEIQV